MRKRHNGFTSFMKKLDGETNNDNFSETEGLGIRVHQGYECLLELLRGDICWNTYFSRFNSLSFTERHDMYYLRKSILGLDIPSISMGVYIRDRSYYREAVEYLRQHQASEQQETVSADTNGPLSFDNTEDDLLVNTPEDSYSSF